MRQNLAHNYRRICDLPPRNTKDESRFVFLSYPIDAVLLEWRYRPRHRVGMDLSTRLLPGGQRTRRLPRNSEYQREHRS